MSRKDDLTKEIIDKELEMFLNVRTQGKATCQEDPDSFRMARRSLLVPWSEETLESYLNDLKEAEKEGRNFMTEKYARMGNLIPKLKENPLIDKIVEIQYAWQKEMFEKYPNIMCQARPLSSSEDTPDITSFETYLKGELETYSDRTLTLLYNDVKDKWEAGESWAEDGYRDVVEQLGYDSLEDAEMTTKERGKQA